MAREIVIKKGDVAKIAAAFRCTNPTIRRALRGADDTLLAVRIREYAKKLGGKYTVEIEEIEENEKDTY